MDIIYIYIFIIPFCDPEFKSSVLLGEKPKSILLPFPIYTFLLVLSKLLVLILPIDFPDYLSILSVYFLPAWITWENKYSIHLIIFGGGTYWYILLKCTWYIRCVYGILLFPNLSCSISFLLHILSYAQIDQFVILH